MDTDKLNILVIDNEQQTKQHKINLLQINPFVSEIITSSNTNEAILKIINTSPDIILIEYPPQGNTEKELFDLIKSKLPDSCIAFISDTKYFAKSAIQNGIYNYIIKPIQKQVIESLIESTYEKKQSNSQYRLDQIINNNQPEVRLRFLTNNGYIFFNPDELLFCKATDNFTEIYLTNNKKENSQLSLVKFEENLTPYGFVRISRTHLINPKYIKRVFKKGNIITMSSSGVEHNLKAGKELIKKLGNLDIE